MHPAPPSIYAGRRGDKRRNGLAVPSVPGWLAGRPDYEKNPDANLYRKLGIGGYPGDYDQMILAWPYLRRRVRDWQGVAASLVAESTELDRESIPEEHFADALDGLLLGRRVGIESANSVRWGLGHGLRRAAMARPLGAVLLHPRWERGKGLNRGDRVILRPVPLSGVQSIGPGTCQRANGEDYTGPVVSFWGANGTGWARPLSDFLLFTNDADPGEYFGRGELRGLLPLWELYQLAIAEWSTNLVMQRGIAKIWEGTNSSDKARKAAEDVGINFGEGRNWHRIPGAKGEGADIDIVFPSGTPATWGDFIGHIKGEIDALFGSEAMALGHSDVGSRAAGEVMQSASEAAGHRMAADLIDVFTSGVADWVARQERYPGRVRMYGPATVDATNLTERAQRLATLNGAGLLGKWSRDDINREREIHGLDPLAEDAPEPEQAPAPSVSLSLTRGRVRVIVGPPASGKSTFAGVLARETDGPVTVIDSDRYLYDGDDWKWTRERSYRASSKARAALTAAMERGDSEVIFVAPLLAAAPRRRLAEMVREAGYTPEVFALRCGPEELERRNATRAAQRQVPPKQLRAMADAFAEPEASEGWERVRYRPTVRLSHASLAVPDKYAHIDFRPSQGMRDAARNGLDRHDNGETGDGIKPETIRRGHRIADGEELTPEHVTEMAAWFARHGADGAGEPGSPEYASWQLWGGDAGEAWARARKEQMDAADRKADGAHDGAHDCGAGCGCGADLALDVPTYQITGADGREIAHVRPALAVEVRGVTLYPENFVPLMTDVEAKQARFDALAGEMEQALDDVRSIVFTRLEDANPAEYAQELQRAKDDARAVIAPIVDQHFDRVEADARRSRETEAQVQADSPITGPGVTPEELDQELAAKRQRYRIAMAQAVDTIVNKVTKEAVDYFATTGSRTGFTPERNVRNYLREVEALDSGASNGVTTVEPPREGMKVTAAVRLSTKSARVCSVCEAEDGRVFRFPEDVEAFKAYRDLPDPLCTSAAKVGHSLCECTWALIYGNPEGT